jgi:hypothetical protein
MLIEREDSMAREDRDGSAIEMELMKRLLLLETGMTQRGRADGSGGSYLAARGETDGDGVERPDT